MPFSRARRDVIVYLPPSYNSEDTCRYPVLYLNDGQNLFDPATAFLGNHWGLREVVDDLIVRAKIQPLILVGIYNRGAERVLDYTHIEHAGVGGRGRVYGKLIVERLKPFIDREYRTLSDSLNTGLGGSSLGGLVSLYLGLHYPQTFGKLLVMSPSIWWAERAVLQDVRRLKRKTPAQIWLDTGTCEGRNPQECVQHAAELRDALLAKGWQLGYDLAYLEDQGAGHDERAWGSRMRIALNFLFPSNSVTKRQQDSER